MAESAEHLQSLVTEFERVFEGRQLRVNQENNKFMVVAIKEVAPQMEVEVTRKIKYLGGFFFRKNRGLLDDVKMRMRLWCKEDYVYSDKRNFECDQGVA